MTLNSLLKSTWKSLPHAMRDSTVLRSGKNLFKSLVPVETLSKPYLGRTEFPAVLTNIEDLDQAIQYAESLEAHDQDAFFRFVNSISFQSQKQDASLDPFSEDYRRRQFEIFELLRSSPYSVHREALPIYVNETIEQPYPYVTKSSEIVGNQLIAIGSLIKAMNLKPGQSVLEMGGGHGNNTLQLTQLHCDVTSIDISKDFLKVIQGRLKKIGKRAHLIQCDFLEARKLNRKFDAVIFNASFHHCSDHQKLVQTFNDLVAADGKVYFCNEPIFDHFPIPWGLRMDGESVFHIRLHGWLELGFQKKYFLDLMQMNGWTVQTFSAPLAPIFCASRAGTIR